MSILVKSVYALVQQELRSSQDNLHGPSECQLDSLTTEVLEIEHWSRGYWCRLTIYVNMFCFSAISLAGFQFFLSLVTIIPSFHDRYFQILMNVEWVTTTVTQMPSVWILMVAITALAVLDMKAAAIHATVSISTVYWVRPASLAYGKQEKLV